MTAKQETLIVTNSQYKKEGKIPQALDNRDLYNPQSHKFKIMSKQQLARRTDLPFIATRPDGSSIRYTCIEHAAYAYADFSSMDLNKVLEIETPQTLEEFNQIDKRQHVYPTVDHYREALLLYAREYPAFQQGIDNLKKKITQPQDIFVQGYNQNRDTSSAGPGTYAQALFDVCQVIDSGVHVLPPTSDRLRVQIDALIQQHRPAQADLLKRTPEVVVTKPPIVTQPEADTFLPAYVTKEQQQVPETMPLAKSEIPTPVQNTQTIDDDADDTYSDADDSMTEWEIAGIEELRLKHLLKRTPDVIIDDPQHIDPIPSTSGETHTMKLESANPPSPQSDDDEYDLVSTTSIDTDSLPDSEDTSPLGDLTSIITNLFENFKIPSGLSSTLFELGGPIFEICLSAIQCIHSVVYNTGITPKITAAMSIGLSICKIISHYTKEHQGTILKTVLKNQIITTLTKIFPKDVHDLAKNAFDVSNIITKVAAIACVAVHAATTGTNVSKNFDRIIKTNTVCDVTQKTVADFLYQVMDIDVTGAKIDSHLVHDLLTRARELEQIPIQNLTKEDIRKIEALLAELDVHGSKTKDVRMNSLTQMKIVLSAKLAQHKANVNLSQAIPAPIGVYVEGPPGHGKSTCLQHYLPKILAKFLNVPEDQQEAFAKTYVISNSAKYFGPYNNEPVAFIDEVGAVKELTDGNIVSQMTQLLNCVPISLATAALDGKNQVAKMSVILMASNRDPMTVNWGLSEEAKGALLNRLLHFKFTDPQYDDHVHRHIPRNYRRPDWSHIRIEFGGQQISVNQMGAVIAQAVMDSQTTFNATANAPIPEVRPLTNNYRMPLAFMDQAKGVDKYHTVLVRGKSGVGKSHMFVPRLKRYLDLCKLPYCEVDKSLDPKQIAEHPQTYIIDDPIMRTHPAQIQLKTFLDAIPAGSTVYLLTTFHPSTWDPRQLYWYRDLEFSPLHEPDLKRRLGFGQCDGHQDIYVDSSSKFFDYKTNKPIDVSNILSIALSRARATSIEVRFLSDGNQPPPVSIDEADIILDLPNNPTKIDLARAARRGKISYRVMKYYTQMAGILQASDVIKKIQDLYLNLQANTPNVKIRVHIVDATYVVTNGVLYVCNRIPEYAFVEKDQVKYIVCNGAGTKIKLTTKLVDDAYDIIADHKPVVQATPDTLIVVNAITQWSQDAPSWAGQVLIMASPAGRKTYYIKKAKGYVHKIAQFIKKYANIFLVGSTIAILAYSAYKLYKTWRESTKKRSDINPEITGTVIFFNRHCNFCGGEVDKCPLIMMEDAVFDFADYAAHQDSKVHQVPRYKDHPMGQRRARKYTTAKGHTFVVSDTEKENEDYAAEGKRWDHAWRMGKQSGRVVKGKGRGRSYMHMTDADGNDYTMSRDALNDLYIDYGHVSDFAMSLANVHIDKVKGNCGEIKDGGIHTAYFFMLNKNVGVTPSHCFTQDKTFHIHGHTYRAKTLYVQETSELTYFYLVTEKGKKVDVPGVVQFYGQTAKKNAFFNQEDLSDVDLAMYLLPHFNKDGYVTGHSSYTGHFKYSPQVYPAIDNSKISNWTEEIVTLDRGSVEGLCEFQYGWCGMPLIAIDECDRIRILGLFAVERQARLGSKRHSLYGAVVLHADTIEDAAKKYNSMINPGHDLPKAMVTDGYVRQPSRREKDVGVNLYYPDEFANRMWNPKIPGFAPHGPNFQHIADLKFREFNVDNREVFYPHPIEPLRSLFPDKTAPALPAIDIITEHADKIKPDKNGIIHAPYYRLQKVEATVTLSEEHKHDLQRCARLLGDYAHARAGYPEISYLTMQEAINGNKKKHIEPIDMSTAIGNGVKPCVNANIKRDVFTYDHNTGRYDFKDTNDGQTMRALCHKHWTGLLQGKIFSVPAAAALKAEILPEHKAARKRVFYVSPLQSLLSGKRLIAPFQSAMQGLGLESPFCTNIDPVIHWNSIIQRMLDDTQNTIFEELDWENYDASVPSDLVCLCADYIAPFYRDNNQYSQIKVALETHFVELSKTPFLIGNSLIDKERGIPSGTACTSQIDPLPIDTILFYSFCINHNDGVFGNPHKYATMVHRKYCGDDVLLATVPGYEFDLQWLTDHCKSHYDMTITGSSKDSAAALVPFRDAHFVSRRTVQDGKHFLSLLKPVSMAKATQWTRTLKPTEIMNTMINNRDNIVVHDLVNPGIWYKHEKCISEYARDNNLEYIPLSAEAHLKDLKARIDRYESPQLEYSFKLYRNLRERDLTSLEYILKPNLTLTQFNLQANENMLPRSIKNKLTVALREATTYNDFLHSQAVAEWIVHLDGRVIPLAFQQKLKGQSRIDVITNTASFWYLYVNLDSHQDLFAAELKKLEQACKEVTDTYPASAQRRSFIARAESMEDLWKEFDRCASKPDTVIDKTLFGFVETLYTDEPKGYKAKQETSSGCVEGALKSNFQFLNLILQRLLEDYDKVIIPGVSLDGYSKLEMRPRQIDGKWNFLYHVQTDTAVCPNKTLLAPLEIAGQASNFHEFMATDYEFGLVQKAFTDSLENIQITSAKNSFYGVHYTCNPVIQVAAEDLYVRVDQAKSCNLYVDDEDDYVFVDMPKSLQGTGIQGGNDAGSSPTKAVSAPTSSVPAVSSSNQMLSGGAGPGDGSGVPGIMGAVTDATPMGTATPVSMMPEVTDQKIDASVFGLHSQELDKLGYTASVEDYKGQPFLISRENITTNTSAGFIIANYKIDPWSPQLIPKPYINYANLHRSFTGRMMLKVMAFAPTTAFGALAFSVIPAMYEDEAVELITSGNWDRLTHSLVSITAPTLDIPSINHTLYYSPTINEPALRIRKDSTLDYGRVLIYTVTNIQQALPQELTFELMVSGGVTADSHYFEVDLLGGGIDPLPPYYPDIELDETLTLITDGRIPPARLTTADQKLISNKVVGFMNNSTDRVNELTTLATGYNIFVDGPADTDDKYQINLALTGTPTLGLANAIAHRPFQYKATTKYRFTGTPPNMEYVGMEVGSFLSNQRTVWGAFQSYRSFTVTDTHNMTLHRQYVAHGDGVVKAKEVPTYNLPFEATTENNGPDDEAVQLNVDIEEKLMEATVNGAPLCVAGDTHHSTTAPQGYSRLKFCTADQFIPAVVQGVQGDTIPVGSKDYEIYKEWDRWLTDHPAYQSCTWDIINPIGERVVQALVNNEGVWTRTPLAHDYALYGSGLAEVTQHFIPHGDKWPVIPQASIGWTTRIAGEYYSSRTALGTWKKCKTPEQHNIKPDLPKGRYIPLEEQEEFIPRASRDRPKAMMAAMVGGSALAGLGQGLSNAATANMQNKQFYAGLDVQKNLGMRSLSLKEQHIKNQYDAALKGQANMRLLQSRTFAQQSRNLNARRTANPWTARDASNDNVIIHA